MLGHDTEIECEDWTTEVTPPVRAFYATTTITTPKQHGCETYSQKLIHLLPPYPKMSPTNYLPIASATLGSQNRRTRHINIRYPYIRDCVESGTIAPHYTSTSDVD
jgi:hypothetical protein